MKPYNLPFKQISNLSKGSHFLFAFCSVIFLVMSRLMLFIGIDLNEILPMFLSLFFLICGLFFSYYYISAAFLKSFYLEMTEDYLRFFTGFKTHTVKWNKIYEAQVYSYNNNTALAILLEKDRLEKTKRSLSNNFSAFSGVPPLSFSITIRLFKGLDIDRLLFTMQDQIDKHYTETYIEDLRIAEYEKQFQNNLPKALVVSFLFSIIFGIGYGFSIQLLNKNFLAIPLFSSILIISIFNKYYEESSVNILSRLSLGVLCLFQMITGLITAVMLAARLHINPQNILVVIQNYMEYFISSPWENVPIFIWGLMCLGMGIFHGSIKIKARN